MASIIHSFRKIYQGGLAFETHTFFVIVAMFIAAAALIVGLDNFIAFYAILIIVSFFGGGYFLKFMHNNIKAVDDAFPDIDLDIVVAVFKAIPVYIVIYLVCFVISLLLMFIPIIGPIIAGVLTSVFSMVVLVLYCENFKYGDALNFKRIKELVPNFIVPYLLLMLKAILIELLCTAIIGLLFWILKANPFVLITAIAYVMMIVMLAFNDNIATIYNEVSYGDVYESSFYTEQ